MHRQIFPSLRKDVPPPSTAVDVVQKTAAPVLPSTPTKLTTPASNHASPRSDPSKAIPIATFLRPTQVTPVSSTASSYPPKSIGRTSSGKLLFEKGKANVQAVHSLDAENASNEFHYEEYNARAFDMPSTHNRTISQEKPDSVHGLSPLGKQVLSSQSSGIATDSLASQSLPKQKVWPIARPSHTSSRVVQTNLHNSPTAQGKSQPTSSTIRKRHELLPQEHLTSIERNWALLLKLIQSFPEDRGSLISPLSLTLNVPSPAGIHVFIDASNIIIGFHDAIKRARGIPLAMRVPRVDLNFGALALLLERRRPVAKRVLAGSTPEIPAYEEARQAGYETCILDKVYKAKEMTDRQRKFAAREQGAKNNGYSSGNDSVDAGKAFGYLHSDRSTAISPAAVQHHPAKWVEQAVDEILHLKILESIIDTPSVAYSPEQIKAANGAVQRPTMVLATGDAAEAEYSSGFMKMVERALSKGWNVEVVSWAQNTSHGYRRLLKDAHTVEQEHGEKRFVIIELDKFAENLFAGDFDTA